MQRILLAAMVSRIHCNCLQHAHRQVTFGVADHRGEFFEQGS
jgi:hypothetical protein